MKKRFLIAVTLTFLIGSPISRGQAQTNIVFKLTDGTEKVSVISALSKITFSGSNLILNFVDGTTNEMSESTIQKMLFSSVSSIQNLADDGKLLKIYPNPASDFISFMNASEAKLMICVYRMDGVVVLSTFLDPASQQLDISSLQTGLYLIKVNNQVMKFSKI